MAGIEVSYEAAGSMTGAPDISDTKRWNWRLSEA
jgi:hypothetical protein